MTAQNSYRVQMRLALLAKEPPKQELVHSSLFMNGHSATNQFTWDKWYTVRKLTAEIFDLANFFHKGSRNITEVPKWLGYESFFSMCFIYVNCNAYNLTINEANVLVGLHNWSDYTRHLNVCIIC